jgi:hypothetical protein
MEFFSRLAKITFGVFDFSSVESPLEIGIKRCWFQRLC